jgi:hypothetical protein
MESLLAEEKEIKWTNDATSEPDLSWHGTDGDGNRYIAEEKPQPRGEGWFFAIRNFSPWI